MFDRRYPIPLHCYLGRLWQADNRLGIALEPLRLVLPDVGEATKVSCVELRGVRGSRSVTRHWKMPVPGVLFVPSREMYATATSYFPEPRETWWPGERLVVEFLGDAPEYASVIARRKAIGSKQ